MASITYDQKMLELQIIGIVVTSMIAVVAFFYVTLPTDWNSTMRGLISIVGTVVFVVWFGYAL